MDSKGQVLVVDDEPKSRQLVCRILESEGYATRQHAAAAELLHDPERDQVDCILLDLHIAGTSDRAIHRWLHERGSRPAVVFMSGENTVHDVVEGLGRGTLDFVEKPIRPARLLEVVGRAVQECKTRAIAAKYSDEVRRRIVSLTDREREVCAQIVTGSMSKEIAKELNVSPRTVEHYRRNVLRKMGAANAADLTRMLLTGAAGAVGEL
jgi:two-component system response regulator FixJ